MTIRNIIEELDRYVPERDKHKIMEQRANHLLTAIINLKEEIRENFTAKEADELIRRIDNSVKGEDPKKFTRKIRELKENSVKRRKGLNASKRPKN